MNGQKLVLALTKPEAGLESYVIVGELVETTDNEIKLVKAVSPGISSESNLLMFHNHIIPMTFVDGDYINNVIIILRKDFLYFYSLLDITDPHPLCREYMQFWNQVETTEPAQAVKVL